ncbi:MAG: ParB/RepB/Spo0J family partition protein, partial [Ignavibacteria bacterium]
MKPGLGRGLDALLNPEKRNAIPDAVKVEDKSIEKDDGQKVNFLARIPVASIRPNPYQPRTEFDEDALQELRKSILENGLIQPITVRRADNGYYELISGERRFRAFKDIGYKEIPAYIIKVDSKEAMVALALIENIQREQLNAIEIAKAYKRLMDECALSQEEIAEKVGKDRTTITNSIRLLKLPSEVQQSLVNGEISAGHARALINLPNRQIQLDLLHTIKTKNLSVRKVEALVKSILNGGNKPKASAPGKTAIQIQLNDIENRLRGIYGTKVVCKQKKDGTGEIKLEFYS